MIALLWAHFGDKRIISSDFRIALPPRSPDVNPCDFCLWGFLKDHVYRGNIETVPKLKASITHHVSSINRETLRATIDQAITCIEHVIDLNKMHIELICD